MATRAPQLVAFFRGNRWRQPLPRHLQILPRSMLAVTGEA